MDPLTLAARVRGILGTPGAVVPAIPYEPQDDVAATLGGTWGGRGGGPFLLVERCRPADDRHGRSELGDLADDLRAASTEASLLCGRPDARAPFLFFDLETSGLSGGAGTLAFLVGCGWFDDQGGFRTRQYLLTRVDDEPVLLDRVASQLSAAGALVSYNGKSFDAPVLETRYLLHRLAWPAAEVPHLDMLHLARRFWRDEAGCALTTLECQVLGAPRQGDVAGFEIPARYFQFLRDGDGRPLAAVLEHNRLDLLSLAALTARLARLVRLGPAAAHDAREALALGHVLQRAGEMVRAREAFERASEEDGGGAVRAAALRALALDARRGRRFDEAAAHWRRILEAVGGPAPIVREAMAALAVHHEHRARDLTAARTFALRSLDADARPGWNRAVRHRVARLDRKLERLAGAPLLD